MSTRTYTRTFLAEVTQTRSITDDHLTDAQRRILDAWESGQDLDGRPVLDAEVDEILEVWDSDDEDVNAIDDWNLTIERID